MALAPLTAAAVSSFRTLGSAATPQNLFSLEAGSTAGVALRVSELELTLDQTAILTAVAPQVKVSRPTAPPTGGTTLSKVLTDPMTPASDATVVARGATASDGGAATAITATAGPIYKQRFIGRTPTAVGWVGEWKLDLLPPLNPPLVVRPGGAVLVQIVATAGTSNPATNHYAVNCSWEEISLGGSS